MDGMSMFPQSPYVETPIPNAVLVELASSLSAC